MNIAERIKDNQKAKAAMGAKTTKSKTSPS
jgi:hypothetical protein